MQTLPAVQLLTVSVQFSSGASSNPALPDPDNDIAAMQRN